MPLQSRWSMPISETSIQTWLFQSPDEPLDDEKALLIDANQPDTHSLTLSAYRLWSKRVAIGLQKAGLEKGDRVLLFSGNNIFFPVVFMGIVMAGGVFTGANPTYVARELAHQLKDSGAKFLICIDGSLDVGLEAASTIGMSKDRIYIFDDEAFKGTGRSRLGVRNWNTLLASENEAGRFVWEDTKTPKDTTCCLNYSSGTTGIPKGVDITHYNHIANAEQLIFMTDLRSNSRERVKSDRWLCFLPMYHAYGQAFFVITSPKRLVPAFIMPKFDFIQFLGHIQNFKITALALAPPIAVALTKHPAVKDFDLSSVRDAGSGAAPLSDAVAREVERVLPNGEVNLKQGWGMTETTCSVMSWHPLEISKNSSVGELHPNCSARIMSDDGLTELPCNSRGELWVRGPNVMKGYWGNPKATAETMTWDGWLKTGDIAYVDPQGKFFIVDRKKELIKVSGNQVAPAELEAVLLEHEAVADAAVVGVTIDNNEWPRAYIVLKESWQGKISEREIAVWMEGKVSRYKRLVAGVVFIEAIPKNMSGKIIRNTLRERAKGEIAILVSKYGEGKRRRFSL